MFCCSVCLQGFLAKVEKVGLRPRHKLVGGGYREIQPFDHMTGNRASNFSQTKLLASLGESELLRDPVVESYIMERKLGLSFSRLQCL